MLYFKMILQNVVHISGGSYTKEMLAQRITEYLIANRLILEKLILNLL